MAKTTEDKAAEAKAAEDKAADERKDAMVDKPTDKPTLMKGTITQTRGGRLDVRDTGLAHTTGRYVRVLQTSYINGAVFEPGEITHWPEGVEKLGPNLEEVKR